MAEEFSQVSGFLSSLTNPQRERFLREAENRESSYHIWLFASAMGYEGSFCELEAWLIKRYPQLNRRQMLAAEAVQIESDIAGLRRDIAIPSDSSALKPGDAIKTIATLSKELRGHLGELDRMTRAIDRRGLILSGADRLLRILQDLFADDEEMQKALTQAFDVLWTSLAEER